MEQRDRQARAAVAAAFFVQGFCFAALLTQVNVLQAKFGLDDGQLSLVLLAVPVVAGLGSVLAGLFAARFGSSAVLRVGGPGVCLAVAAAGAAGTHWQLFVALAAVGMALGVVDATMNMQGVAVERRYRRPVLSSFHAVWSVGGIAGALATAGTAMLGFPIAAALGSVAAVGALVTLATGPAQLRRHEEAPDRALGEAPDRAPGAPEAVGTIPWRPIVLIGTAMMLMFIADSAVSNWSAVYLDRVLSASTSVAALGIAAYQACMLLGRAVGDRIVRRVGQVAVVAAGAATGCGGLLLVSVAPAAAIGIIGFAVVGLGLSLVVPQAFSAAGRLDPAGTGVAVARVNLFNYLGFVLGAGLIGAVAESATLRLAFAVPAVLSIGIVALAPSFRVRPTPAVATAVAP